MARGQQYVCSVVPRVRATTCHSSSAFFGVCYARNRRRRRVALRTGGGGGRGPPEALFLLHTRRYVRVSIFPKTTQHCCAFKACVRMPWGNMCVITTTANQPKVRIIEAFELIVTMLKFVIGPTNAIIQSVSAAEQLNLRCCNVEISFDIRLTWRHSNGLLLATFTAGSPRIHPTERRMVPHLFSCLAYIYL